MTLQEKIDENLVQAMKEKDELKTSVLRMLKSAIKNKEIEKKSTLEESDIIQVIQSQIKSRQDSIEMYKKGDRPELAEKEQKEVAILKEHLPEQMPEEELRKKVKAAIQKTGAQEIKDMGKVMGILMAELKGKADGSTISRITKEELQKSENEN